MKPSIFLFGEAEKGEFGIPFLCDSLPMLCEALGEPPPESQGIHYAIQTLLYDRSVLFYRVQEEGFSTKDYLKGLYLLQKSSSIPSGLALCLPGVGDEEILDEATKICSLRKSFLVLTEKDLYDYLSNP
ncbi:MAG: hypothetical protein FJZ58_01055 [Chlamydiae bacterium]|nr:hypothetical protein [Chlamydiota bacterium]